MPHPTIAAVVRTARRVQGSRARDGLVCGALTVLALLQSPGRIVADTKIDMALNPLGFLNRVLHLWDPSGSFGQLQNQAYGYLWPMGPFFALGTGIGLPAWVVQRLWWALLLSLAYLGAVRLADRLGIGTPTSRLIAGLAFALSPRIVTQIGAISAEAWPTAIAPWVLIPLVGLAKGAETRRAVTLSALAVACAGGINATAVIAVLPLGLLWLLTLSPLRRRLTVLAAWCGAVVAATLWWAVPLLILGRYSPPFGDYVERASTTTGVTDPVSVLRGANYWLAYLHDAYRPWLPAGWEIATNEVVSVATVLLALVGLAGLSRPGLPQRRFLVTALLAGFALVGMGHVAELPGTFAGAVRELLDGVAAPLRNVHKFDVVLRLPLALGVAHLLALLTRAQATGRAEGARTHRWSALAARLRLGYLCGGVTVVSVALVASPALAGGLAAAGGFRAVPGYWRDAAAWLNAHEADGRVLVIPGANFPNYTWGDTLDEVTQPLLTGEAAVRSVIPMSPATTIRMMDAIESVLATGSGSPALADYLARAGVSYLLVRNDLNYGESAATAPVVVQQALSRSPGLVPAATFGPDIRLATPGGVPDELGVGIPALQVLRVDRPVEKVVTQPAQAIPTVVGGPESLLWLDEVGLLPPGPTVLVGDRAAGATGPVLLTDGLRLRDVSFGSGRDAASTTLTAEEGRDARDYLPPWGPKWTTKAAYTGVAAVRVSTSSAYKNPTGTSRPEHQPYAALDGDPQTSWQPEIYTRLEGQWLEVTLDRPQSVPEVTVHFDESAGGRVTRISVDAGAHHASADVSGDSVTVALGVTEPVDRVRLTIDGFEPSVQFGLFGVAELEIPGVAARRTLVVPAAPEGGPATVLLHAAPAIPSCYRWESRTFCSARVARGSEDDLTIDRSLTLAEPSDYRAMVWARARAGAGLYALLDSLAPGRPAVSASSAAFDEALARPGTVVDGDPGTTWWAAPDDPEPELRLSWPTPRTLTGLRFELGEGVVGTPVGAVTVVADGRAVPGTLTDGELRFDQPVRARELTLRLAPATRAKAFDPYTNKVGDVPVAVSEIVLLSGAPNPVATDPGTTLDLPCGSGPQLAVGDRTIATRLRASAQDLLEGREVPAVPCGPSTSETGVAATLGPGAARVVASASDLAVATRVALVPTTTPAAAPAEPATVHIVQWSSNQRVVTVGPHATDVMLVVRENTNPGWVATLGGVELSPIIVDGWQQGWLVPAGLAGRVELRFQPDTWYRAALAGGAALVLLVVLLAAIPPRRRSTPDGAANPQTPGVLLLAVVGAVALLVTAGALGALIVAVGLTTMALRASGHAPTLLGRSPAGRLLRATAWLVPAALLLVASAGFSLLYEPWLDWRPQLVALLAVGAVWLHTMLGAPAARRRRARPPKGS